MLVTLEVSNSAVSLEVGTPALQLNESPYCASASGDCFHVLVIPAIDFSFDSEFSRVDKGHRGRAERAAVRRAVTAVRGVGEPELTIRARDARYGAEQRKRVGPRRLGLERQPQWTLTTPAPRFW